MRLQLRRPAAAWTIAAATGALALLAALWFGVEWLLEGPEEARADWAEHVWVGAAWILPSALWLAWRRPRSRFQAFATAMLWAALISGASLLVLFRFLAEDFGLPARVSGLLVLAMAAFLIVYQLVLAILPAIVLQLVAFGRSADTPVEPRLPSSLPEVP